MNDVCPRRAGMSPPEPSREQGEWRVYRIPWPRERRANELLSTPPPQTARDMNRTRYHVEKMDCAAEERLVRMRLDDVDEVASLVFDLERRTLEVIHRGSPHGVTAALNDLHLGARQLGATERAPEFTAVAPELSERGPLQIALGINATLFALELGAGLIAGSMGLIADALDMLADALVYALSLAAVGRSSQRKRRLARTSGWFQAVLACLGLAEVVRRVVLSNASPEPTTMALISTVALMGNVATLLVLRRVRTGEAHIEASWIFTANDVQVNALVIGAAGLVWATGSALPDLLAGALIFAIVANGSRRILTLAR